MDQSLVSELKRLGYNMTSSAGKLKLGDVTSVSRLNGDTSAAGELELWYLLEIGSVHVHLMFCYRAA